MDINNEDTPVKSSQGATPKGLVKQKSGKIGGIVSASSLAAERERKLKEKHDRDEKRASENAIAAEQFAMSAKSPKAGEPKSRKSRAGGKSPPVGAARRDSTGRRGSNSVPPNKATLLPEELEAVRADALLQSGANRGTSVPAAKRAGNVLLTANVVNAINISPPKAYKPIGRNILARPPGEVNPSFFTPWRLNTENKLAPSEQYAKFIDINAQHARLSADRTYFSNINAVLNQPTATIASDLKGVAHDTSVKQANLMLNTKKWQEHDMKLLEKTDKAKKGRSI